MNIRSAITQLLFAINVITPVTYAADHIRIVAMPGQQAPGFSTGVSFNNLADATINASGELTFVANLVGPGIVANGTDSNNNTVWVGTPDNLQLLAQEGQPAPGTEPDTVFNAFTPVADGFESPIAPNGEVAFFATLRGPSIVGGVNDHGIWAGTPGNLQLVARRGDHAPGTETGTVFATINNKYAYNDSGVAFYGVQNGPNVGNGAWGIWSGRAGNVQLVVRNGDTAPDLPTGSTVNANGIQVLSAPLNINSQGELAFLAVTSTLTDANRNTVYAGAPGAVNVIAREGDFAPGVSGATFRQFSRQPPPTINDAGQVSFYDPLTLPGSLLPSLWVGTATSLTLAALQGDPAPAPLPTGTVIESLGGIDRRHLQNAAGKLAMAATVSGPSVTSSNDIVLLTGTPGDWTLLAREGDPAPSTEAGVVYTTFDGPFINSIGEVAFKASLSGTTGNEGIWIMKPGVPPRLIARNNDSFDAGGGNIFTIQTNGLAPLGYSYFTQNPCSGNQDGRPSALSDNGQVVFSALLVGIGTAILIADPLDTDNDGVRDNLDNCINVTNSDQRDTDGDGYGNRCDADFNGDLIVNLSDYSVFRSKFGTADPDADFNGDGVVNLSDYSIFRAAFGKAPGPSCCAP